MAYPYPTAASSFFQTHCEIEMEKENQLSSPSITIEASTSASCTAADFTTSNIHFDVFINHRGCDTKKTLASHLYCRLLSHGLRAFLDQEELQQGSSFPSQIQDAIRTASVHVAIFSPKYAESKWCLDELLLMLESGTPIIPVFYHVKPAELRWTENKTGVYAEALRELQMKKTFDSHTYQEKSRYDSTTIQNWRNALSTVADISGLDLEAFNGYEGPLVDKVVEHVVKIWKETRLHVAKYPTGLDQKVRDFETMVLRPQQTGKVQVVGIVGLGGVGKTTLALELFNRKRSNYKRSYFLSDVRENAKNSLHSLQSKILKGLIQLDLHIDNMYHGIEMLKKHLSSSQVLLILDDIDHVDQLDALLPVKDVLRSDSLILITCRDKDVLARWGEEESSIYKLNGLNTQHSRELFCSYAFGQVYPLHGFEDLVDKFLRACGGLPLSLKVFGALFNGKNDKSYWEDILNHVQVPTDIQKRLKNSYDTLTPQEQQIFLDIACFFIGKNREKVITIGNELGWNGLVGFQNLQDKCLVEVNIENNIHMHDHLRDLGREIAKDSWPRRLWHPSKNIDDLLQPSYNERGISEVRGIRMLPNSDRSDTNIVNNILMHEHTRDLGREVPKDSLPHRLWHPTKNIGDLLQRSSNDPGISEVRGIRTLLNTDRYDKNIKISQTLPRYRRSRELLGNFAMKLSNRLHNTRYRFLGIGAMKLQLLETEGQLMERILRRVHSPNLIWLSWLDCPYSYLPSWIPMNNLRVLEVSGRQLKTLWQTRAQAPLQLRELQIDAPLSNIPKSIGQLKHLERIVLSFSTISGEVNLEKLPAEFCHLKSLKALVFRWCSKLKSLPDSFGNLTSLQHIELSGNLERLPDSFCNLKNLEHIYLYGCQNLKRLPDSFGNLTKLQHIDMSWCHSLQGLPDSFGNLTSLQHIRLSWCKNLQRLPDSFGNLTNVQHIRLSRCQNLERLPDSFGSLNSLKYLDASGCSNLSISSDTLGNISTLQYIDLSDCAKIEVWPSQLAHQRSLKDLKLTGTNLKELPSAIGDLGDLEVLELGSPSLHALPSWLGDLKNLEEMRLQNCGELKCQDSEIFDVGVWSNLQHLFVIECNNLVEVRKLPNTLIELELHGCSNLRKIEGLCGLAKLQTLNIIMSDEVEALPSIETLVSLEELKAFHCVKLKSIRGLAQLTKFKSLDVRGCLELEELEGVDYCKSFVKLDVAGCPKLQWGHGVLEKLRQQKIMDINLV